MNTVTKEFTLDLTNPGLPMVLYAVKGEESVRKVTFNLYNGTTSYTIPSAASVSIAFVNTDGHKGVYKTLPNGSKAYEISGNSVSVILAPEVCTGYGTSLVQVNIYDTDGKKLKTWTLTVKLDAQVPDADDIQSKNYYTIQDDLSFLEARLNNLVVGNTKDNEVIDARVDYNGVTHESLGAAVRDVTGKLKEDLGNIDKAVFDVFEESENINLSFTNGKYYWRDKANFAMVETETSNARYSVVSLENGQKYRYEGSYPKNTYPALVFFDDNNIAREVLLVSATNNGEKATYEFIADTSIATKLSINCLSIGYTTEPKLEKLGVTKKQNKIDILANEINSITEVHSQSKTMKAETLSDWQSILFDEKIGIRKNVTSMFYADITSFSKVYIGYTPTNANGGVKYIAIDNVNLYVYGNTGRVDETYPHELSFGENISVILDCNDNTKCKVTILTNGLFYQKEVTLIPYPLTALYCLSEGSMLKNVKLSWCCKDILKEIWVFGDSYVDLYNVRWMWYLIQNGYGDNILLSGVAGSTSADAIISFKNLLKYGKPKYAVWCMGMNDFNDADISTPNTVWKTAYDEFLSLCKSNNILPILTTIPNVPQRTHIAKNKIVKESGYRYIDFAHAVGADEQGATWYNSLLSSDNVHPSVQGARVLYGEALASFPEFTVIN